MNLTFAVDWLRCVFGIHVVESGMAPRGFYLLIGPFAFGLTAPRPSLHELVGELAMPEPFPLVDVSLLCGECHALMPSSRRLWSDDQFDALHVAIDAPTRCPACSGLVYRIDLRVHPVPPGEISSFGHASDQEAPP